MDARLANVTAEASAVARAAADSLVERFQVAAAAGAAWWAECCEESARAAAEAARAKYETASADVARKWAEIAPKAGPLFEESARAAAETVRAKYATASSGVARSWAEIAPKVEAGAMEVRSMLPAELQWLSATHLVGAFVVTLCLAMGLMTGLALAACRRRRFPPAEMSAEAEEHPQPAINSADATPTAAPPSNAPADDDFGLDRSGDDSVAAVAVAMPGRSRSDTPPRRPPLGEISSNSVADGGKHLDLLAAMNTGSLDDLMLLPGVGLKSAERIQKFQGEISNVDDLLTKVGLKKHIVSRILRAQGFEEAC